jgi:hypothetical protein
MKEYILKPITTPATLALTPNPDKPAIVKLITPRQPLPTAVMDPAKPMLKLGLDVHLEFIMAVAQKDHANPYAPASSSKSATRGRKPHFSNSSFSSKFWLATFRSITIAKRFFICNE